MANDEARTAFGFECNCCEAVVSIVVVRPPASDLEDFDTPYPEGVYCPFCSSYISFNEGDLDP